MSVAPRTARELHPLLYTKNQMRFCDPGPVRMGFVVDRVALGQVFPRALRVSPVNFIPPVLHYLEKRKKIYHLHHRFA
jgi:hypothetical protein